MVASAAMPTMPTMPPKLATQWCNEATRPEPGRAQSAERRAGSSGECELGRLQMAEHGQHRRPASRV